MQAQTYLYMCVCICVCGCECASVLGQQFSVYTYLIKKYKHFCLHNFFIHPFKLAYRFFDILREFLNKPSIVNWFPTTVCPITVYIVKGDIGFAYIYIYIYIYIYWLYSFFIFIKSVI